MQRADYTIPRNKWELQRKKLDLNFYRNYTIPRNKWELQHERECAALNKIIPYQEINGNYNKISHIYGMSFIIPYQEINGNYNISAHPWRLCHIIPYQEINGNYNKVY